MLIQRLVLIAASHRGEQIAQSRGGLDAGFRTALLVEIDQQTFDGRLVEFQQQPIEIWCNTRVAQFATAVENYFGDGRFNLSGGITSAAAGTPSGSSRIISSSSRSQPGYRRLPHDRGVKCFLGLTVDSRRPVAHVCRRIRNSSSTTPNCRDNRESI